MNEYLAHEHGADLRRAAVAYNRSHTRADRASTASRATHAWRLPALHRTHSAVGCEA